MTPVLPGPSPRLARRVEIVRQAQKLLAMVEEAVDDPRDLSLSETLEHDWQDGIAQLRDLELLLTDAYLSGVDDRRLARDAQSAREFARAS